MKKHIPNLLTLCNLLCGCLAVFFAVNDFLTYAAYMVIVGLVFDFLDGFAARILKVESPIGKQLDSLADVVTFGLAPAFVMMQLLYYTQYISYGCFVFDSSIYNIEAVYDGVFFPLIGLLIALASAYRLAKFNVDTRQTDSFIGLPTPANALWIICLPMIPSEWTFLLLTNTWVLIGLTLLSCYLLTANIPMFALKFKKRSYKENQLQYNFIVLSIILLIFLQFAAVPLIIGLYVLVSLLFSRKQKII